MGGDGPVLVVGGSGQIGQQLVRLFAEAGRCVVGTYYQRLRPGLVPLDASDVAQVAKLFDEVKPAVVINASNAAGGTDACELRPELAERYHFQNARNLVDATRSSGAKFLQVSTDYVFDGECGPYDETAPVRPLSQLGRAKARIEEYVFECGHGALIARTSFVFSWTPETKTKNFVMQIFDAHQSRRRVRVPVDQVGNVTYAPNLAAALVEMLAKDLSGLYHVAGTTRCSKYEWALRVIQFFKLDLTLIEGVTTPELCQPGPRPLQSGFVLDKAQAALSSTRLLSLDEGLAAMKRVMDAVRHGNG